jgi:hypothetical protein
LAKEFAVIVAMEVNPLDLATAKKAARDALCVPGIEITPD